MKECPACHAHFEDEPITVREETVAELNEQISILRGKVLDIQKNCLHKHVKKEKCQDVDDRCPGYKRYWTEIKCLDCEKEWHEDYGDRP